MFKFLKIKKLEREIQMYTQQFVGLLNDTEEITFDALQRVYWIKDENDLSWDQTLKRTDTKAELFQLLLHKQYLSYLVEHIRQKTIELKIIKKEAPKFGLGISYYDSSKTSEYSKEIEQGVAKDEMQKMYKDFEKDIMHRLIEVEKLNDLSI